MRHQHGGTGGDAHSVGALGLPRLAVDAHHAGLVLAGRDLVHDGGGASLPPVGADGVDLVAAFEAASEGNEGGEADRGHADEQRPLDDGPAPGERRHGGRGGAEGERPHEEEDRREHLGQGEAHDGDQPDPAPGLRRVDVHGRGSCRSAATVPRRPCFGCTGMRELAGEPRGFSVSWPGTPERTLEERGARVEQIGHVGLGLGRLPVVEEPPPTRRPERVGVDLAEPAGGLGLVERVEPHGLACTVESDGRCRRCAAAGPSASPHVVERREGNPRSGGWSARMIP